MIDPGLWESTPFGNLTALQDYYGMEAALHRAVAQRIVALTGQTYSTFPLGDGGGPAWLEAHQSQMQAEANLLNLTGPPDLTSYDLRQPDQHGSYFFLAGQWHRQLKAAAGIV